MQQLICSTRYPVVPIDSLLLTITFYSSVGTTFIYNVTKYSVSFMMLQPSSSVSMSIKLLNLISFLNSFIQIL